MADTQGEQAPTVSRVTVRLTTGETVVLVPQVVASPVSTETKNDELARVYRAAMRSGRAPMRAVAEHFEVPDRTASRWIDRARKAGHQLPRLRGPARPIDVDAWNEEARRRHETLAEEQEQEGR